LLIELCQKIIFNDPAKNCIVKGSSSDWDGLPRNKSLFHSPPNCGLPIGNLTSQVFANFYLNSFDHFMEKQVGRGYYARYVDDFIVVSGNKAFLMGLIEKVNHYLTEKNKLTLHPKKIYLQHCTKGVKFLGAVIKQNRVYISNKTKGNIYEALKKHNQNLQLNGNIEQSMIAFRSTINSYLGLLKHFKTYRIRQKIVTNLFDRGWFAYFYVGDHYLKIGNLKTS
jgi:hypothetical protein